MRVDESDRQSRLDEGAGRGGYVRKVAEGMDEGLGQRMVGECWGRRIADETAGDDGGGWKT